MLVRSIATLKDLTEEKREMQDGKRARTGHEHATTSCRKGLLFFDARTELAHASMRNSRKDAIKTRDSVVQDREYSSALEVHLC